MSSPKVSFKEDVKGSNSTDGESAFNKDKRMRLVGHRKSGYCGHVPQYVFFDQDLRAESPTHADKFTLVKANTVPVQFSPTDYHAPKPVQMYPFHPAQTHQSPKMVVGFSGHRVGEKFHTGGTVNAKRKTELLPSCLQPQLFFPELGKPRPIPKYPIIRGPTRMTPLGQDCFLSN